MKRIISIITVCILCLCLLSMNVLAASAEVTTDGPQSVKVGQTLDVALVMTGSDIYGMEGKISYDESLLKLNSSASQGTNWLVEFYNNNFVVYDNLGENPVNGTVKVVVLNFTVLEAAAGKTISVAFTDLVATDAENDIPVSNATYSCAVKAQEVTPPATTAPSQTPATEATEPATTVATQPATEATEPATEEATEPATEEATEPATGEGTEPTEPGELVDPLEGHRCLPWWLLIVALVLGLVIGYLIGKKSGKKKEQAA